MKSGYDEFGASGKVSSCNAGDPCSIPGLGREWLPTPVSCLENSMDRGAWWATVLAVARSRTQLSN